MTRSRTLRSLLLVLVVVALSGCVQRFAIRTVGGIMDYGLEAFNEESDLPLAQGALGSNLKLIDALIKADPDNNQLPLLASQGYSAYALAFVEDEEVERARVFYLRGRDYGLRLLTQNKRFRDAMEGDLQSFHAALASFSRSDVPAVFWTAFGWGNYINITRASVQALADLPRVNAMMEFVLQHDPAYYYAGAHLYFGSIHGSIPVVMGGKPDVAKHHFEQCLALTEGKFLLAHVYYAKTYAVQVQERELFDALLKTVEAAPLDLLPEARLANAVAKRKAAQLRAQEHELFKDE